MRYRLGDTVGVPLPVRFEVEFEFYFDEDGRPCNKDGTTKYLREHQLVTIETQDQLDHFNAVAQMDTRVAHD